MKRKTKKNAAIEQTVETDCKDPDAFALVIEDESMWPAFQMGDHVIFAPNSRVKSGQAAVVKLKDGKVLFGHFHRKGKNGATVRVVKSNPHYSSVEVSAKEIAFAYPAWELKRDLTGICFKEI